jgi:carboxyl-terminal processing protease
MKHRGWFALVGALLLITGFVTGFQIRSMLPQNKPYENPFQKFSEAVNFIASNYFEAISLRDLIDKAIIGLLDQLDPHSFYIPPQEMEEIETEMQGSFEGIGIEFQIVEDTLLVVAPIAGGPSEEVGIQAGDRIVEVDGKNIAGIGLTNNDVFKLLRGPKNTKVKVKVFRPGVKELLEFTITRDKIPIYSVDFSYMVNDTVGYLKINRFASTTFDEFRKHLSELKKQGLKHLILDLRGNPGGYMRMAELISDAFLSSSKLIVYTKGRVPEANTQSFATARIADFEKGGLVILIDEGSASASEIVSGAIQDWDRGLIVGRRSFGKGLVQFQHEFQDRSAMRIVVARYFTPSGRCIQKPFNKSHKAYEREIVERFEQGELFDSSKIHIPDSLKFYTKGGRPVYGGGGIIPDRFVPRDTTHTSSYLTSLIIKGVFREFALKYRDAHPEIKELYKNGFEFSKKFEISEKIMKEFIQLAKHKEIDYDSDEFKRSQHLIKQNLKAMLGRAYFREEGFYPAIHSFDTEFQEALKAIPEAIQLYRNFYLKHE